MVPMTILVTATATLVYIHSRFVERPAGRPVDEHQVFALTNKFVACTASMFATAVGFAALAVSDIRPIRDMGLWVAVGLVQFTVFDGLATCLGGGVSSADMASRSPRSELVAQPPRAIATSASASRRGTGRVIDTR